VQGARRARWALGGLGGGGVELLGGQGLTSLQNERDGALMIGIYLPLPVQSPYVTFVYACSDDSNCKL